MLNLRRVLAILMFALLAAPLYAYTHSEAPTEIAFPAPTDTIKWMSWEEAVEQMKVEKRKILVEVFKPDCGWCAHLERTTLNKDHIGDYINANYYPVRFNAMQEDPVELNEKTYRFTKKGGQEYHEFAALLTMGRLSYPTIAIFDSNMQLLQPLTGYKDPSTFEKIMTYYAEDHHKRTPWSKYEREYVPVPVEASKN